MSSTDQFNLSFFPEERARKYFKANRHVLVIEGDKAMRLMIEDILEDAGFEVATASNWPVALEQLQQQPIDFIILDISLPEGDGFEIYDKLQNDPDTKDIPVLMATIWTDKQNLVNAERLGIKHVLPKPFTEDELLLDILSLLVDSARQAE
jgi:CheY-like chemotaxis protein